MTEAEWWEHAFKIQSPEDFRNVALGGAAFLAAIVGLPLAYFRTRAAHRHGHAAQQGHITDRFAKAIEHLSNNDLTYQLGGIYALERIARDSRRDHWTVMEVLCGFIRTQVDAVSAAGSSEVTASAQVALEVLDRRRWRYDEPRWRRFLIRLREVTIKVPAINVDLTRLTRVIPARIRPQELAVKIPAININLAGVVPARIMVTILRNVRYGRIDLHGANLRGAQMEEMEFPDSILSGAHLEGANLSDANLQGADLSGAHLQGADLSGAGLQKANLRRANLEGADLGGADLEGADMWGAHLAGAILYEASLEGADLREATLEGADLREASLEGADLSGANLKGADLPGTHLKGR